MAVAFSIVEVPGKTRFGQARKWPVRWVDGGLALTSRRSRSRADSDSFQVNSRIPFSAIPSEKGTVSGSECWEWMKLCVPRVREDR